MGLPMYVVYTFAYMLSVEYFVYWSHRLLHDITLGYKCVHACVCVNCVGCRSWCDGG